MTRPVAERIAAAPISWGVSEVAGWGWQHAPATVLQQMRQLGLVATEFGPDGFLPDAPTEKAQVLAAHGLAAVGQFVPVLLHDPHHDPLPEVERAMTGLVAAGASTVVVAAATGLTGYDTRPVLDEAGWTRLLHLLDEIDRAAAARGLVAALHPHVGTMIESEAETRRVLDGSRIGLCLDTGHLLIGGGDPVALAREVPQRVVHVHLKDVDLALARRVRGGELSYTEGVAAGMYVALGAGDVDVAAIVTSLEDAGYQGWYVLEQDTILPGDPSLPGAGGPTGADPVADVAASLAHLRSIVPSRSLA